MVYRPANTHMFATASAHTHTHTILQFETHCSKRGRTVQQTAVDGGGSGGAGGGGVRCFNLRNQFDSLSRLLKYRAQTESGREIEIEESEFFAQPPVQHRPQPPPPPPPPYITMILSCNSFLISR